MALVCPQEYPRRARLVYRLQVNAVVQEVVSGQSVRVIILAEAEPSVLMLAPRRRYEQCGTAVNVKV